MSIRTEIRFVPVLLAIVSAACGDSLGDCDRGSAEELVYSQYGFVATKGQALMNDSCGNGAFCHSAKAVGDDRSGAPKGMNFDMLPHPTGWVELMSQRDAVWDAIDSGRMPPPASLNQVMTNNVWLFDRLRSPASAQLSSLKTYVGKAAMRNWLACGAPLVSDTQVPDWAQPKPSVSSSATHSTVSTSQSDVDAGVTVKQ